MERSANDTPLASIRGYAELTRRTGADLPDDVSYAMGRVESEARRMTGLVEDLLLLARLDSGPYLDLQPVDLAEVVLNAVSDARAAGPDHVWRLSVPDEPVVGLADRVRDLPIPITIMAGTKDRIVDPKSHAQWFHEQIPGSVLHLVPGAGHMVHCSVPDQVADAIDAVSERAGVPPPVTRHVMSGIGRHTAFILPDHR